MRLKLGPIVGHTDQHSTRIWIRVSDPAALTATSPVYSLRIKGVGAFPFVTTESAAPIFGTAIATALGLREEWLYRYQVLRHGRVVPGAEGSFRTMPAPSSFADVLFVSVSCSDASEPGAWPLLRDFIARSQPRFLLLMGDQVYLDADKAEWRRNLKATQQRRRRSILDLYQRHWDHEPVAWVLANIPTYMMWDDHDFHNGWGSNASDSATLAERYPKGKPIYELFRAYFDDAREIAWHFQLAHGPRAPDAPLPPVAGAQFAFRCGRLAVIVADNRGARDYWRAHYPVLGAEQWKFLRDSVTSLPPDTSALALVTPLPLVSMSPGGVTQTLFGKRSDDIELFAAGRLDALLDLMETEGSAAELPATLLGRLTGENIGNFELNSLSDVRDNWASERSRPEQEELIRLAAFARFANHSAGTPREVVLVGGDLHAGGLFDVELTEPAVSMECLITSGVSQQSGSKDPLIGTLVDENFEVAAGIRARLKLFTPVFNFGITHCIFEGEGARIQNAVEPVSASGYWGIK